MTMSGSTADFSDDADPLTLFPTENDMSSVHVAPLLESEPTPEFLKFLPKEDRGAADAHLRHGPVSQASESRRALASAIARYRCRYDAWLSARRALVVAVRESGKSIHRSPKLRSTTLVIFACGVAVGVLGVLLFRMPLELNAAFASSRPTWSQGRSDSVSRGPQEPASPAAVSSARPAAVAPRQSDGSFVAAPVEQLAATVGRRETDRVLPTPDSRSQGTTSRVPAEAQRIASANTTGYRGSLAVNSSPRGAQVFVNNRLVGTTPLLLKNVSAGARVVRLELDGYQSWSAGVSVVANEQVLTTAALQPSPKP